MRSTKIGRPLSSSFTISPSSTASSAFRSSEISAKRSANWR
jgi:hypothetical protein